MSSHTPKPWYIKHGYNIFGNRRDVGHEGSLATFSTHSSTEVDCGPESEANLRLAMVSPDFYDWAERFLAKYNAIPKDEELPAWIFLLGNELKEIMASLEDNNEN